MYLFQNAIYFFANVNVHHLSDRRSSEVWFCHFPIHSFILSICNLIFSNIIHQSIKLKKKLLVSHKPRSSLCQMIPHWMIFLALFQRGNLSVCLFQFVSGSWDKMLKLWSAGRSVAINLVGVTLKYCYFLYLPAYAHFPTMYIGACHQRSNHYAGF